MALGCHVLSVILVVMVGRGQAQDDFFPEGPMPTPDCGSQEIDLLILLDSSEKQVEFEALRQYAADVVEFSSVDSGAVRVGFVSYSAEVNTIFHLDQYRTISRIQSEILRAPFRPGRRNTAGILRMVTRMFQQGRDSAPDIVLLLTTGRSQMNAADIAGIAREIKESGVQIFATGVNVDSEAELDMVVSRPLEEAKIVVNDIADLSYMADVTFSQICARAQSLKHNKLRSSQDLDLVFLLHFSDKMSRDNHRRVLSFMKNVVQAADVDSGSVRVGAAIYEGRSFALFNLNQYGTKQDLLNGIDKISFTYRSSSVNAASGFDTVRRQMFTADAGDRADVPNAVIVVTDANANIDVSRTIQAAEDLRNDGAFVYSVGINLDSPDELEAMASELNFYDIENFDELSNVREDLVEQIASRKLSYVWHSCNKCNIYHILVFPVSHESFSARKQADIVIVFQASQAIKPKFFKRTLVPFFSSLVSAADVDTGAFRFALVNYANKPRLQFGLSRYTNKAELLGAIKKLKPKLRSNKANAGEALKFVRTKILTEEQGDRPDAPNVVLLVSDSKDSFNREKFFREARVLKDTGAKIYSISLATANENELRSVASEPVDLYYTRFSDTTANQIAARIRDRDSLGSTGSSMVKPEEPRKPATVSSTGEETVSEQATSLSLDNSGEADLIVLFHVSPSMKTKVFRRTYVPFLQNLISNAEIDSGAVRVAFVNYANKARVQFHLNKYNSKAAMKAAIRKFSPKLKARKANAGSALQYIRSTMFTEKMGDRPGVPNGVILVTGTKTGAGQKSFLKEAEKLKQAGVKIFTIGVDKADTGELRSAASGPSYYYYASSYDALGKQAVSAVGNQIYSLSPFPRRPVLPPTDKPSLVTLSPVTGGPDFGLCAGIDLRKTDSADIVFALHFNPRGSDEDFRRLMNYMSELVQSADMDSGKVRFGMYVDGGYMPFQLKQFDSIDDLTDTLSQLPKRISTRRSFDLIKTLKDIRTKMFTADNGDRPNVANVVILITDTSSTQRLSDIKNEAKLTCDSGITVFSIGVGLRDKSQMEVVASNTRNIYTVSDYTELERDGDSVRREIMAFRGAGGQLEPSTTKGSFTGCSDVKLDIVFVVDSSTSVREPNFRSVLGFIQQFLTFADIDGGSVRVGLLTYSTDIHVQFYLNDFHTKLDVLRAVDTVPYRYGNTNTAEALETVTSTMFSVRHGDRSAVDNLVVVITDGVSNINAHRTIPEAERARAAGIRIVAIGVGLVDTQELDGIASRPVTENRFLIQDFSQLMDVGETIFSSFCTEEMLYVPEVTVDCSVSQLDLVFVTDSSTSVTETNFRTVLEFLKSFLSYSDLDHGNVRVGMLVYSTDVHIQFHLDAFNRKADVLLAIDKTSFHHGNTNTAAALRELRTDMFSLEHGDRPNVQNVALFVTDGVSNINETETIPEALRARSSGIEIYAVGVGLVDTKELDGLASDPVDIHRFIAEHFSQLQNYLAKQIFTYVCRKECAGSKLDLVFVLDASTSVTKPNFQLVLDFTKDFISFADIDGGSVRVGVVVYSTRVHTEFYLDRYSSKSEILEAIDSIPYTYGSTNTADGLKVMRRQVFSLQHGDRPDVDNMAIVVTDGVSNINSRQTLPQAQAARDEGITIYVIGIGLADTRELDGIASLPIDKHRFIVQDFSELRGLHQQVFTSFCPEIPLIIPTPRPVEQCAGSRLDLVFVLDASTSVTKLNFQLVLEFTKNFISFADIDGGSVRVGVVVYSTSVHTEFYLDRYSSKSEILEAIDSIPYTYGSTNTADGLKVMRREVFSLQHGDRPDVDNMAIVVTDGVSNINSRQTLPQAQAARDEGITIYVIGIGLADTRELDGIASLPIDKHRFIVQDFSELQGLHQQVFTSFCSEIPLIVPTPPPVEECAGSRLDLVFVLDASTSVTKPNFQLVLEFTKNFISFADIDGGSVRVGVVIYSTSVHTEFYLDRYSSKSEILEAIDSIPYTYGSTNTADGLKVMRRQVFSLQHGDRPDVDNMAIVVTDGVSNINSRQTLPQAQAARDEGITIYVIGIGLADTRELDGIASLPIDKHRFIVQDFSELQGLHQQVFTSFCPEIPLIVPTPPPVEECAGSRLDLVFVLDASTSVTKPNFQLVLEFTKDFISFADIDGGSVRVGVVVYSTSVHTEFYLDRYSSKSEILEAIDSIPYTYGSTNTADGLKVMRKQVFSLQHGDRPDVDNMAIVVTDGVSNINSRQTLPQAQAARDEGITIYVIGIGLADTRELDGIASLPIDKHRFIVHDFSELQGLHQQVFTSFCPEKSTLPPTSLPFDECRSISMDVIFVLDSSTSVSEPNFKHILQFLKQFLKHADVSLDVVRVGVITYSTSVHIEFSMNEYFTKSQVFSAIEKIPYRHGSTNTADALRTMRNMFSSQYGDRPGVKNVAVVVTDGVSNINSRRTIPEAESARAIGIHIYAIGIGLADTRELDGIASLPVEENRFIVKEFSELSKLGDRVFLSVCPGMVGEVTFSVNLFKKPISIPQPEFQNCEDAKIDLIFVLDASTSVTKPNFKLMLDFLKDFLYIARIDNGNVRVGLVIYSTRVHVQFQLNDFSTKSEVYNAIDNTPYEYGSTNTADGIKTMRTMFTRRNGDRPDVRNIAIVITDGVSNINARRTIPEAEGARDEGIHIYAIGIGLTDTREIDGIASPPVEENRFTVTEFSELRALRDKVFRSFCVQAPPVPITTPPPVLGSCEDAKLDLIFVLDASTSVTEPNFKIMLNFLKDFLYIASIDSGNVRVGLVIYSTRVHVQFQLNDFSSKGEVYNAIDNTPYEYGSTNTADGLKTMRTMFTRRNGDRPDVKNVAIVITDGVSNINARRTIPEAEGARAEGIHIYAIGIGLTDTREIDGIASKPIEENRFTVQEFSELRVLRDKVFRSFCVATPIPITLPPPPPMNCENTKLDLIFVLDASTSVTKPNFKLMLNFLKDFLYIASIDTGNVRVGLVIYSTRVNVQFQLNDFSSKGEVYNAIDNTPYEHGSTNTADGLKTMRTMFSRRNGDRPDVKNVAIVITDGVSNINARRTIPEAERARDEGIHIYAIGIGLTDTREIDGIASPPIEKNRFTVQEFSELRALRDKVFQSFCVVKEKPKATPKPITLPPPPVNCENTKLDLIFVLDASTSVTKPNFKLMLNFLKDFLYIASIDTGNVRVGLVIYSTRVHVQFQLNDFSSKGEVYNAIDNTPYEHGSTNTADGLKTMRTMFSRRNGDRPDVKNVAIVITDGVSNINARRTIPEAERARDEGIHIYAIGIGLTDTREIDGIASPPIEKNRFTVQEFSELRALRDKVFQSFCVVKEKPKATPIPITLPPPPVNCENAKLDLIFVLDASTSVTEPNFKLMLNFLKDFLYIASIDTGNVRVGLVIYSTRVHVQFQLNDFSSKGEVYNAIDNTPYEYGSTNTADGLKTMRTMFSRRNGDRPDVKNVAIVITDGVSNINARRTIPEAEGARDEGIHIYAIGIGLTDTREIDGIASPPIEENRFTVQEFSELRALRDKVFQSFCVVKEKPKAAPIPITLPPPTESCENAKLDLIFVLDASTSVTEPNFKLMLNFLKDFLYIASIDTGNVRVGLVIYSTRVNVQFQLNDFSSKGEVYNAIDNTPYEYGSTNTADGLKTMRTMFSRRNGDRPDVKNVAIVITDGVSNINARRTIPEAEGARDEGIHIYAIGIGLTDTREIDGIASPPIEENRFTVQEFSELRALRDKVFQSFCVAVSKTTTGFILLRATPIPITLPPVPSCESAKIDLIFVLDASTSVTEPNFKLMLNFLKDFLYIANIDNGNVRVGLVIYSTRVHLQFHLNEHNTKNEVYNAIDNTPYRYGSTNTADGIKEMRSMYSRRHGDRPNVPNIAIVITDGVSNINARRTIPEAEGARAEGIHIYVIGIGLTDTREIDGIASPPIEENRFAVQEFHELRALRDKVFHSLCGEPNIKVTFPPTTEKCGLDKVDLVIILDSSTSVTQANFVKMLQFTKDLLRISNIDNGDVRVGVVTYSTSVKVRFHLKDFRTKAEVEAAIDSIPYDFGSTNTADAIRTMRDEMFLSVNGDRPDVPNVCIVITDGVSNINSRRTVPDAQAAHDEGIHIYAIGIGLTDTRELDGIASPPSSANSFTVNDFSELENLDEKIFSSICPVATFEPPSECSLDKVDLVIILDSSTSVTDVNFIKMKNFVKDLLKNVDLDSGAVRVGVVIYSTRVSVMFHLNQHKSRRAYMRAVDEIPYQYGSTNTAGGLKTMRTEMFTKQNGDRRRVKNVCIVVTDGVSNINARSTVPEAERARAEGIHIYAIGIGLTDTRELDQLSSRPKDPNTFIVNDFDELVGLDEKIFGAACPGRTPKPTPSIELTTPRTPVYKDSGYDIVFMLDGTVDNRIFKWMTDFTKNYASQMDIDSGDYRVGAMTYTRSQNLGFNINEYNFQSDVVNAVNSRLNNQPGGRPDLGSAFDYVRKSMFTQGNGDRPNARNFVVMMTGNEKSLNTNEAINAANRMKDAGYGIFTIGMNVRDTSELDEVSSQPLDQYQYMITSESELPELPGIVDYQLRAAQPTPKPKTPVYKDSGYDIVFMLDGTADNRIFKWMTDFTKNYASQMDIDSGDYRVGAMTFTRSQNLGFNINEYDFQSDVVNAVGTRLHNQPGGRPDLGAAFDYVRKSMFTPGNGDRPNAKNFVVMMTGNEKSLNTADAIKAANRLKDAGYGVFTVGLNLRDTSELDQVSSKPLNQYQYLINSERELQQLPRRLGHQLTRAQPTPKPRTPVYKDSGYDIVFMLDGTADNRIFKWMTDFTKNYASQMDIDSGDYRVGAMTFTRSQNLGFNINEYDFQSDVVNAVGTRLHNQPGGRPDLGAAFDYVRKSMFTPGNGDRPNAKNFVVMMTGNEKSLNTADAIKAANRLKDAGYGVFTVGLNLRDTSELDQVSSKPLNQYQYLINSERELQQLPRRLGHQLTRAQPTPKPRTPVYKDSGYDIVFMLDGTADNRIFKWMTDFTKNYASQMDIDSGDYRVGAMTFTRSQNLGFNINEYDFQSDVVNAVGTRLHNQPGGRPDLGAAFDYVRKSMFTPGNGDRPNAKNFVVMMTGNEKSLNTADAIKAANRLKDAGYGVFTVGLNLRDTSELDQVSSKPLNQYQYLINSERELQQLPRRLGHQLTRAQPTPKPRTPVYKDSGYDIVFMLDGTVDNRIFKWMTDFTKNYASQMDIDSGDYRVGAMTYTRSQNLGFNINEYDFQSDVVKAIDTDLHNQPGGRPDLGAAFDYVRKSMFTPGNGDRPNAKNFVVMMTGNEKSLNTADAINAANRLKNAGYGIFTVGLNLRDTSELDQVSSKPLNQYQYLINSEQDLQQLPRRLGHQLTKAQPTPKPRTPVYKDSGYDIVFMLDGTVDNRIFKWMTDFTKNYASQMDIDSGDYRVGAMTFTRSQNLGFNINEYDFQSDVVNGVDTRLHNQPGGRPDLGAAFDYVRKSMFTPGNGDRPNAKNFVVMMTGNEKSLKTADAINAANRLKNAGYGVFTVGLNLRDTSELDQVSSKPLNQYQYLINSEPELQQLPRRLGRQLTRAQPTPKPRIPVHKDTGYDVVFMLDGTVDNRRFNWMKDFVKNYASQMDVDSGDYRVGAMTYTRSQNLGFNMNDHLFQSDVVNAMDSKLKNRPGGQPDLGAAFDYVRNSMFTQRNGDRPNARNFVVMVTGSDRSVRQSNAYDAANRLKDAGFGIFTVGLNIRDTREIDEVSSKPLNYYQYLVNDERGFSELPGRIGHRLERAKPTPRPATVAPTPARTTAYMDTGYDIVFMLDGTTNNRIFKWMTDFAQNYASQMEIDSGEYRVGGMTFTRYPNIGFNLNDYGFQSDVINAFGTKLKNRPGGEPDFASAFDRVRQTMFTKSNGDRPNARNFVMLLTGNERSLKKPATWAAANRLKDAGFGLFTVGFNIGDTTGIDEVTSKPLDVYQHLVNTEQDLSELPGIINYQLTQARPTRKPTPPPTTTPPPRTTAYMDTGYDVIFMLDGTVTPQIFGWMTGFVRNFASEMNIDSGEYRVGGMTFTRSPRVAWNLNDYGFEDDVINAVGAKMSNRPGGRPDLGRAFDTVRGQMFTYRKGDRPNARNFIIMMTANERSQNRGSTYRAADRLKHNGVGIYTIGFNLADTTEIDAISTLPLDEYEHLINDPSQLSELPGIINYKLRNAPIPPTPPPATRPPTTPRRTRPTTPRPTRRIYTGPPPVCTSTGDIVFIIDSSGSVGQVNFYHILNFTADIVRGLDVDAGSYRVGMITFSTSSNIEFHLRDFYTVVDVIDAIRNVQYSYGYTHTAEALRRARTEMFTTSHGDRPDCPNLAIIITDGQSNINHIDTLPEARRMKREGITVLTLAVGFTQTTAELQGMTSQPINENLLLADDFQALSHLKDNIVRPICTDGNLCDENPCRNEAVCLDGLRSYTCVCRPGFFGDNCQKSCGGPADVVMILDSSNSIGPERFTRIKMYAETLVREMNIEACDIRVGVMKYSSAAMIQFNLGTFRDQETISRAIDNIHYTRGRANMAGAFSTARLQMFNRGFDRPDARKIAYLFTDGVVQINKDTTLSEAELMIESGVRIVPLGVDVRDESEIKSIASAQGMGLIQVEDEIALQDMSDKVLESVLDTGTGENYCADDPCENRGRCFNRPGGFKCECIAGYSGDTCGNQCLGQGDVVFVMDRSRYVSRVELRKMKRFVRHVVNRLAFKNGNHRVAVVPFGGTSRVLVSLRDGVSRRAVKVPVAGIRKSFGDPNLAGALQKVRSSVLKSRGDRRDVPNYVVLVTKGLRNVHDIIIEINKLKRGGSQIVGVGLGLSSSEKIYMESIVSSPDKMMFDAEVADDLETVTSQFGDFVCEDTVADLCNTDPCQNGGVCEIADRDYICRCRPGWAGKNCDRHCDDRADVVVLIDSSGSVGYESFRKIKDYLRDFVSKLNIGADRTRVGVATFSQFSRAEIYLDSYYDKRDLMNAISGLTYEYGNTNTASGIKLMRSAMFSNRHGDRPDVPNFAMVITDGLSNVNSKNTIPQADMAKKHGVHIFSVGVGTFDPWEVDAIATEPHEKNAFKVASFDNLNEISTRLIDAICRDPGVCADSPCLNGGICVPTVGDYRCECSVGFLGKNCELDCQARKDIAFILDSSTSVGEDNFKAMLTYVQTVVKDLTSNGRSGHAFSLITYNTDSTLVFSFGRYHSPSDVVNVIETTKYTYGSTNTADALRTAIEVFSPGRGERRGADNIAILITDGESNINYHDTVPAATDLKNMGVRVVAIGIGLTNTAEINAIASSQNDVFQVNSFENLEEIKDELVKVSCQTVEVRKISGGYTTTGYDEDFLRE
ncbi:uncharacterized protein LOC121387240 [Gigantopelta aegis]|uniref:uncharacterized protein LOC121387240 n=1 Tax=Gigantopelta aegis TaxID=1735272 RepID=UPI001B888BBD|nr:uncharacterized protein LOC121387240 [Gigantopelta aegis]